VSPGSNEVQVRSLGTGQQSTSVVVTVQSPSSAGGATAGGAGTTGHTVIR